MKYIPTIGLEIHIQLSTKTKAYSSDPAFYGAAPNTNVSPITLGHPGTLPVSNKKVLEYAIKLGLACHTNITEHNEYARKNYFYADLPKGYQITQDLTPICTGGYINIKDDSGKEKQIELTRIHMEEDAGKSIHDLDPFHTLIDLNRAGVPLLEMVSEPVISSSAEAGRFVTQVRKLVRYLNICDGNMEEGSLRCDANISVRPEGTDELGTKVEVKNMNSIRNVQRAIEFEIKRQVEQLEAGETVLQQTRNFDAATGKTTFLRSKEKADDYRYFPEPDLAPILITKDAIESVRKEMPPLPDDLYKKFVEEYQLSDYDAGILTDQKSTALYFEEVCKHSNDYKSAANWMMGAVRSYINENAIDMDDLLVRPKELAKLIALIADGKVSNSVAAKSIFPIMLEEGAKDPLEIAASLNLIQESNEDELAKIVAEALGKFPDKVQEYKDGKKGLLG
ncbi:MAG: Asp-tRNA(Asn)/Glu-tRNA(Gln) amidotransferase subunit GatB, partial [Bacteroidia bacterium]|nr:Asp-tRNA(Asn)/Glu-tRNA(Gln) amidotransferase subunit GatB [Bacteroidia bacterium]